MLSFNQRTRDYRLFTYYFDVVLVCTHRCHPLLQRRVRIDIYTYPSDHFYPGGSGVTTATPEIAAVVAVSDGGEAYGRV